MDGDVTGTFAWIAAIVIVLMLGSLGGAAAINWGIRKSGQPSSDTEHIAALLFLVGLVTGVCAHLINGG